ncbi:uncharacterized protein TM35_000921090 [Trypanosoma theileri]|uniref:Mucin-associated surface protein (MASP) n=1 Tax=Trypanosoma theileri TaxID=67003 RepID=A0A1X0NFA3_9TRYP|nr:uncharacterized protein TM35_000921090 [Trypanosoma theileri]ORC82365.1 hypothetical protein TM35_000921090 [Trypanosoma theileri]
MMQLRHVFLTIVVIMSTSFVCVLAQAAEPTLETTMKENVDDTTSCSPDKHPCATKKPASAQPKEPISSEPDQDSVLESLAEPGSRDGDSSGKGNAKTSQGPRGGKDTNTEGRVGVGGLAAEDGSLTRERGDGVDSEVQAKRNANNPQGQGAERQEPQTNIGSTRSTVTSSPLVDVNVKGTVQSIEKQDAGGNGVHSSSQSSGAANTDSTVSQNTHGGTTEQPQSSHNNQTSQGHIVEAENSNGVTKPAEDDSTNETDTITNNNEESTTTTTTTT